MNVVNSSYFEYLSKLEQNGSFFSGELSALWVIKKCHPESSFYIWDALAESRGCLLKVEKSQDSWRITKGYELDEIVNRITGEVGIKDDLETVIKWWNLCYFKDNDGVVHYDTFYDKYYVSSENEMTMGDLRECLDAIFEEVLSKIDELNSFPIFIYGELGKCNPLVYKFQQKGYSVESMPRVDGSEEILEEIIQLKKRFAIPFCNDNRLSLGFYLAEDIEHVPARCQQTYRITLPIDLIDVNDNAIGSYTYKDILKKDRLSRDYTCCGHDYCYLEMELFADLYGNTVLKVTNSQGESEYTIINKFENVIMI